MIAFLVYVSLVSFLLAIAAAASEALLRATHRATRSVWLAAMLGTIVLALLALRPAPPAAVAPVVPTGIAGGPAIVATRTEMRTRPPDSHEAAAPEPPAARSTGASARSAPVSPRVTFIVAGFWLLASLGCLLRLLAGAWRVARLRRSCRAGLIQGEPVLVSRAAGPAVLGVVRHHIVIPEWVEELDDDAQRLILAHEREHVRARDPLLLHAASLLVALMPWNIPLWVALQRLREAMEIDCDARVLRRQAGAAKRYCRLLLEVGERTVAVATPLLALAERATLLERRIEFVTTITRLRDWKTLAPAAGALLLLAVACRAPRPEIGPMQRFGVMAQVRATAMADRGSATATTAMPAPGVQRAPAAQKVVHTADVLTAAAAPSARESAPDTTIRNEAALRRSALEHQARVDAIADSVILADYPELTRRPPGTPAFLALVLDDRDKLMRHAVSLDPNLPNDLAAIMRAMKIDTISSRTIGLGISANKRWNVIVGYAAEMMGPPVGHTDLRAWRSSSLPYALRRVPYERIVDSVAHARTPEAFREHEGTYAIAMLLDEDGAVSRFAAQPHAGEAVRTETSLALIQHMLGDSTLTAATMGMQVRLQPWHTVVVWGLRQ